ncbi:MAG: RluA family pseudouridine synthase [Acidobacteriota bacterium]
MSDSPEGSSPSERSFRVTRAHVGSRLDRFLQAMMPVLSRSAVQAALDEGRVLLGSGHEAKAARRLQLDDEVTLLPRPAGPVPPPPPELLAGPGWVVVDKPAGLRTLGNARHPGADLATAVGRSPAHRLDRFTSGCCLLTDGGDVATHFREQFECHHVEKTYAAVVEGRPSWTRTTCELPLEPLPESRVPGRVIARPAAEAGPEARAAVTELELVASAGDRSLLRVGLIHGRRHQVRAHAAALGHPLVGDLLHGGDERRFVRFQLGQPVDCPEGLEPGRHLLHARSLAFTDVEGEQRSAVAPWPADFPSELTAEWPDPLEPSE